MIGARSSPGSLRSGEGGGADASSLLVAVRELNRVEMVECVSEPTTRSRGEGRLLRVNNKGRKSA